jgi:hypothetical protein
LQTDLISNPIIFNIPRSGMGIVHIAVDSYVEQQSVNGGYYVSIGGEDVTGNVIATAKNSANTDYIDNLAEESNPIIMYYDPSSSQFLVKREGVYFTMVGQRVVVRNEQDLIVVRKRD